MIINAPTIIGTSDEIRIQSVIEYDGKRDTLWYSFPPAYAKYLSTKNLDGFLVGTLLLAMKLGEDIEVKGAISEKLYYNLTSYYMRVVELACPDLKRVKITAQSFFDEAAGECVNGVATGFSAGVDSFCTVYDHLIGEVSDAYRITHFIFNNVGSHGEWDANAASKLFHSRYELIKGFAEESGIAFVKVDSNLSQVLNMKFIHSHLPRNASVALMLQKLFGKYFYASGFRYQDSFIGPTQDIATCDPAAVHLLSTGRLDCVASGGQYSRVEKTARVAKVDSARRWLNVCVLTDRDGSNCSMCWKCKRTLMTLELLGEIEKFGEVFDLAKWRRARGAYIVDTILNPRVADPFVREIREYVSASGYSFEKKYELLGHAVGWIPAPLYNLGKRAAGKLMRMTQRGRRWSM